jgi:hypothetical protein
MCRRTLSNHPKTSTPNAISWLTILARDLDLKSLAGRWIGVDHDYVRGVRL